LVNRVLPLDVVSRVAGERSYGSLLVTTMASGAEVRVPVHVLVGREPGPILGLIAALHGEELAPVEIIRRVLDSVPLDGLRGTVVAIPVANPVAFEWGTRNTPVDMHNLNRSFPGNPGGFFTEQLASVLTGFVDQVDYLIDFHAGGHDRAVNYVYAKNSGGSYGEEVMALSRAYGLRIIYDGPGFPGTITEYAQNTATPFVLAEVGGGLYLPDQIQQDGIRGVFNVMKHLGMLDGDPILPDEQWLIHDRAPNPRPKTGGIFYPEVDHTMLGQTVPKGTILARIRHPLTLEETEQITAPCEQTLLIMLRGAISKVQPGDYAYIVAEMKTATLLT
jgi:predicted deacylase